MSIEDRGGHSAAWGVAAVVFGGCAVTAWLLNATVEHFPIWPLYTFGAATAFALYLCFAAICKWWPYAQSESEAADVHVSALSMEVNSPSGEARTAVPLPASPVTVRVKPEFDTATNHLRLGVLNRGELGRLRVEVIDAHDEAGNWIGPRSWPVPWLVDGSVDSRDVPMFGKPLLDLAHFDFLGLQTDLDGTKWLNGKHWLFPSLPQPVPFSYSPVKAWSDLASQYIVLTLRVIRDAPEGHADFKLKIGADGTTPYCLDLSEEPEQQNETESAPAAAPVVTDRWLHTSDGADVPALMNLTHVAMSHPGYNGRQEQPPAVKIGTLLACQQIDPSSSGTQPRAKFLAFLNSLDVRDLIGSLTHVPEGAAWTSLAGHGPRTLEAALTTGDDPLVGVPVASALFLPPTGEALYGRSERTVTLILYVEPRTDTGEIPSASDLGTWHQRFTNAFALPGTLADFVSKDLGLGTSDSPPAQLGVWLESQASLTTMVATEGLRTLPGSYASTQFMGWAYADAQGKTASAVARDMMIQMCEYTLHLDDFDAALPESAA